jgi:putative (di)nucleoside polyphosphate hydrolase
VCIGQKQKWFLLQTQCDDSKLDFGCGTKAEFDYSRWVSYWYPLGKVVAFKREVYLRALKELAPVHSRLEIKLNL